jgi:hypothetical protein
MISTVVMASNLFVQSFKLPMSPSIDVWRGMPREVEDGRPPPALGAGHRRVCMVGQGEIFRESMDTPCHTSMVSLRQELSVSDSKD